MDKLELVPKVFDKKTVMKNVRESRLDYMFHRQLISEPEFIAEHYWGYAKINEHSSFEYKVQHPSWQIYELEKYNIDNYCKNFYPNEFKGCLSQKPSSVYVANGSDITVSWPRKIKIN